MHTSSAVSRKHLVAALTLGSVAVLMVGLQPLLLGELLAAGRLSLEGVGLVAMGEIVALGAGVIVGDLLRSMMNLRFITIVAAVFTAALDLMTTTATGDTGLIVVRALAGLTEGLLLWGAVSLIVQGPHPDRVSGLFMVVQTLAQGVIAAVLAFWVLPRQSVSGGFVLLAMISLASVLLVCWQPVRLAPLSSGASQEGGFSWQRSHLLLLAAVFIQLSAIGALWAYMEPLGKYAGLDAQGAQAMISAALFMQVLGGCCGILLVRRVSEFKLLATAAVLLGGIAVGMYLSVGQGAKAFMLLSGFFSLVYLMLTPFQVRIALSLDPSGRVAVLIPGMQLLGCAFGPLVASQWVVGDYVQPVALVSVGFSLLAFILLCWLRRTSVIEEGGFDGKVVLIVGASSGMGRGLALRLAQEGAVVVATARRQEQLNELRREILGQGGKCLVRAADALNEQAAADLVAEVVALYGHLDVVVLNAGGAPALDMRRMNPGQVTAYMRSNYDVAVNYLFPALEQMRVQRNGLIVQTNSLAGFIGVPLQGPYCAAKGALRLLIDTCRIEFGGYGIRFLSLYPGFVATAQTANDGMPAPLELSEVDAVSHMLKAMRGKRWDYLFPWSIGWIVRLARVLPKPLLLWVLRRELPPLPEDVRVVSTHLQTSGKRP
ncbi:MULTISPECIES: SDR family NAD(P)-dependent oxidoreductase [unclassified Pseudomonas]|uniref:SDR family NAD(P)-dependent oxidoreductase n=1 Tax=unclassified Pseudomonas TaxID=196821 RepID=UPI000C2FE8BF|nr:MULTISPECIES: SDR family NAD(P)-dependent oxidoreductase [unclassified Pseudomonas]MCU1739313.1 SDR family NAD(P)-dependent oxidoreductase [Pseudomonas sp. 20S_6.2_Bac1]